MSVSSIRNYNNSNIVIVITAGNQNVNNGTMVSLHHYMLEKWNLTLAC